MKKLSIVVLAAFTALSGAIPVSAAPVGPIHVPITVQGQAENVQWHARGNDARSYRKPPRRGWHNGHRGYRDRRSGYRRHNDGWWYPLAAFGAGAVIGGAVSGSRPAMGGSRHVQWCSERYRTYRASDNTYVPRAGVRATCSSPYN